MISPQNSLIWNRHEHQNLWIKLKGSAVKKLHISDKKRNFLFFIWYASLAKHLVKKANNRFQEWTKQLTQMPIIKPRQA